MVLIVEISFIKEWVSEEIRTRCLPGAKFTRLVETAKKELRVTDKLVFIQSGIPDLHNKRELVIEFRKIQHYKNELKEVHNQLTNTCVILPIYPSLKASQDTMEIYFSINRYIFEINNKYAQYHVETFLQMPSI